MSFGNKMRVERARSGGMMVATLVAAMSMGTTMAPPAPVTSSVRLAPREFVNEAPAKKQAKAPVTNRVKKGGKGADSRKARRRILMRLAGRENTGRQWIRVRRAVRAGPAAPLLSLPAHALLAIEAAGNRLMLAPVL